MVGSHHKNSVFFNEFAVLLSYSEIGRNKLLGGNPSDADKKYFSRAGTKAGTLNRRNEKRSLSTQMPGVFVASENPLNLVFEFAVYRGVDSVNQLQDF